MKRALWRQHEKDIARWFGGQVTAGSGNRREHLDVVKNKNGQRWSWHVECKSTQSNSYAVTAKDWRIIRNLCYEYSADGRPMLAIRFYEKGDGEDVETLVDLAVIEMNDLLELENERRRLVDRVEELKYENRMLKKINRGIEE